MNSKNSPEERSQKLDSKQRLQLPSWMLWSFFVLSFLGFLDTTYLTLIHYTGIPVACSDGGTCERVLSSSYSTLFGIPLALFGMLYYAAMMLLLIGFWDTHSHWMLQAALLLPIGGFIASLALIGIQAFLLRAFCLYCVLSAGITTALFLLSLLSLWKFSFILKQ